MSKTNSGHYDLVPTGEATAILPIPPAVRPRPAFGSGRSRRFDCRCAVSLGECRWEYMWLRPMGRAGSKPAPETGVSRQPFVAEHETMRRKCDECRWNYMDSNSPGRGFKSRQARYTMYPRACSSVGQSGFVSPILVVAFFMMR